MSKNKGSHQKYRLRESILVNVKDRYKVYETQEIARLVIPSTLKELVLKNYQNRLREGILVNVKDRYKVYETQEIDRLVIPALKC